MCAVAGEREREREREREERLRAGDGGAGRRHSLYKLESVLHRASEALQLHCMRVLDFIFVATFI